MMLDAVGTWVQSAYLLSALPLGFAWALTTVFARRTASVRHHVWVVALTIAIVAPVARGVVPRLNVPLLRPDKAVRVPPSTRVTTAEAVRPETIGRAPAPLPSQWSATAIWALVWPVGAIPLLCVRALRRIRLSRLVADGRAVDAQADVRSHARVKVPMVAGFWRPTILLPISAGEWPVDTRAAVLAHERAHVQRHDHVTALVSDVATIVYWLNPLAWMAAVTLEREREAACDQEVLRAGVKPSIYATALLRVAQTLPSRRAAPVPSMGSGQLDARIRAVLHHAPNSGRVPLSWPATMALIGVCAVSVASVRLVARTPRQMTVAERQTPTREIPSTGPAEPPMASPARQRSATTAARTGADSGSPLDSAELGSTLDVRDFCCPDYLVTMVQRLRSSWAQQTATPGMPLCVPSRDACRGVVRFTIERDGTISKLVVEQPTGDKTLNAQALTAVRLLRKLPPLPAAFPKPRLTVHLGFAASAELATPLKSETPAKAVTFSDFTPDMQIGKSELVTVTGQRVAGTVTYDTFMRLDANERMETFQRLTPANQSALVREHGARWRHLNADRLTPEQDRILREADEFTGPEMFERPGRRKSDETIKAFMSLSERASGAFTPEELADAFIFRGRYLPPQ